MVNVNNRQRIGAGTPVKEFFPEAELICAMIATQMHSIDYPINFDEGSIDVHTKDSDLAASMVEAVIAEDTNSNSAIFGACEQTDENSSASLCKGNTSNQAQRRCKLQDFGDSISERKTFVEKLDTKPRSCQLEFEHEHLLRMKLLCKQLETEEINFKIATRKLQILEAEHLYRIKLLKAQIAHLNYGNFVVAEVE